MIRQQQAMSLKTLVKGFSPLMLPERRVEGNHLTVKKEDDYVSITTAPLTSEGDFLVVVMGKPSYTISCPGEKTDDDSFTSVPNTRNYIIMNNVTRKQCSCHQEVILPSLRSPDVESPSP